MIAGRAAGIAETSFVPHEVSPGADWGWGYSSGI